MVFETEETFVRILMEECPLLDGVALDIGAYEGYFTDMLSKKWYTYAFEPLPDSQKKLYEKFKNNPNVTIISKAVSNNSGVTKLYQNLFDAESTINSIGPARHFSELSE